MLGFSFARMMTTNAFSVTIIAEIFSARSKYCCTFTLARGASRIRQQCSPSCDASHGSHLPLRAPRRMLSSTHDARRCMQAATIRGTFSYKHPKTHDVEVRPGMVARMEGVDGEISRIHFVDPNTNQTKPLPGTTIFKNLTSNTVQVHPQIQLLWLQYKLQQVSC